MSGSGSGPLQPTWTGFVQNSMDGLMLFEACLSGKLHHVPRRPHDRERSNLIKSGSVFIYEENASGIKRWTDGVAWSPSRILGNFLIYRELEKPFPPGEKKRAMKRKRSQELDGRRDSEENEAPEYTTLPPTPPSPVNPPEAKPDASGQDNDKEMERQLIGSLVDSYGFRPNGLVKKTMSISLNGVSHHLVSYYTVEDVKQRRLNRPLTDSRLTTLTVRPELFMKQNFRAPVEETEHYAVDSVGHAYPHMMYSPMLPQGPAYGLRPGGYNASGYQMYGVPTTGAMYPGPPATAWPTVSQPSAPPSGYASHAYPGPAPTYDYYGRNPSSTPQSTSGVKQEDSTQNPAYMYPSSYTATARTSNGSGPYPPMQSQYPPQQSPMRSSNSTYGGPHPTSSAPSQAPVSHPGNPAPQGYSSTPAPTHQPAQQYHSGTYGVPHQGGSPHSSLKSPVQNNALGSLPSRTSVPSSMGGYPSSYASQDGQSTTGMSMGSSYGGSAPPGPPGTYASASYGASYNNPPQNFRPTTEGGAGVPASGYT